MKQIIWYDFDDIDGKYAMVGELHIASVFKPIVEKYFPNKEKYHLKYGLEELSYRGIKYETPEEAIKVVEEWWNEFITKIS